MVVHMSTYLNHAFHKRQNQEKKLEKFLSFFFLTLYLFSLPFPFLASWDKLGNELYGLYGHTMLKFDSLFSGQAYCMQLYKLTISYFEIWFWKKCFFSFFLKFGKFLPLHAIKLICIQNACEQGWNPQNVTIFFLNTPIIFSKSNFLPFLFFLFLIPLHLKSQFCNRM